MTTTLTPLYRCESLPFLGGFSRLRFAYSKDILQQELQTETELEQLIFTQLVNWIADFGYADNFSGELKLDAAITDFGVEEKYGFKTIHEVDNSPFQFQKWYNEKIRGRRFALEITNNNGLVRYINPFFITYSYVGASGFEGLNRYELIFTRARLIANLTNSLKVIERITSIARIYLGRKSNDVTVNVFDNITVALFNYGYSNTADISTVVYQNDPTNNVLINIVDGTYYFFAVHRTTPTFYDFVKATIVAGEITIIDQDSQDYTGGDEADNAIFGNNTSE